MNLALHTLAAAAGIEIAWNDVAGNAQTVSEASLRAVLAGLGLPAGSDAQIAESQTALRDASAAAGTRLITAELNVAIPLGHPPGRFRITLESGRILEGVAAPHEAGSELPAIAEPGYHLAELGGALTTLAVAPARAYTLQDAAGGGKLWGLAVQLYALRRRAGGGIGDFAALAEFARHAAGHGADAIAISPVHAQFSANIGHYSPYAPSNRAALNALYIPLDMPGQDGGALIDWPAEGAARLQALRDEFSNFRDDAALAAFRRQAGPGLERHAVFEALAETLSRSNPAARNFRNWPVEYQDPGSAAVARFAAEQGAEIRFHAWLQFMADQALASAQKTARDSGMKIGLIADLAVGTDRSGAQVWARPDEILQGLEIGAPPDFVNREGQRWGITAFSPLGLRRGGFDGFIEMLRHALRHAGGVRIDHVMGLARLWVIPPGLTCAQGAYLSLPVDDLMRLVRLESYRHRAVILGEDLGTLPFGFDAKLGAAGIAGLRVLWFERQGTPFKPPREWTGSAVAMTTTHDLPTVAGWWQGTDIAWREKLGMAGDSAAMRQTERAALWSAFQASGATSAPMPPPQDGAAAAGAACAHLGRTACTLALLPVEDALALPEQPNLPGTLEEHPNWRRRLPSDAQTLFAREDVRVRLAALAEGREK
jgi:4-alpha-glucanotransferase